MPRSHSIRKGDCMVDTDVGGLFQLLQRKTTLVQGMGHMDETGWKRGVSQVPFTHECVEDGIAEEPTGIVGFHRR